MDKQQLLIGCVVLGLILSITLTLVFRVRSTTYKVITSAAAGLLTYFTVGAVISLVGSESLVSSMYFRVFGAAPFVAHLVDRNYVEGEGLFINMRWIGVRVVWLTVILFWTLLFGGIYFVISRSRERTRRGEREQDPI